MPQTLSDLGFNPYSALFGEPDDPNAARLEQIVKELPGKVSAAEEERKRTRSAAELKIGEVADRGAVEEATAVLNAAREIALQQGRDIGEVVNERLADQNWGKVLLRDFLMSWGAGTVQSTRQQLMTQELMKREARNKQLDTWGSIVREQSDLAGQVYQSDVSRLNTQTTAATQVAGHAAGMEEALFGQAAGAGRESLEGQRRTELEGVKHNYSKELADYKAKLDEKSAELDQQRKIEMERIKAQNPNWGQPARSEQFVGETSDGPLIQEGWTQTESKSGSRRESLGTPRIKLTVEAQQQKFAVERFSGLSHRVSLITKDMQKGGRSTQVTGVLNLTNDMVGLLRGTQAMLSGEGFDKALEGNKEFKTAFGQFSDEQKTLFSAYRELILAKVLYYSGRQVTDKERVYVTSTEPSPYDDPLTFAIGMKMTELRAKLAGTRLLLGSAGDLSLYERLPGPAESHQHRSAEQLFYALRQEAARLEQRVPGDGMDFLETVDVTSEKFRRVLESGDYEEYLGAGGLLEGALPF